MNLKNSITHKLVFILITFSVVLVGSMAMATRFSFQEGFLEYVTEAELTELDAMHDRLVIGYQKAGSWAFIKNNHRAWRSYLPEKAKPIKKFSPPLGHKKYRVDQSLSQNKRRYKSPLAPPTDLSGLSARLHLLDVNGDFLVGPPTKGDKSVRREILLDRKVIGFLSLTPVPLPIEGIDEQFKNDHLKSVYYIALAAFILAVLLGIPIGRRLVKPLKAITDGAHKLAQGKFNTRIQPSGQDELGQLAHDFNGLAIALQRNEALRRQGMADISHELRTPLALIRSEIEAMQDGIRPLNQQQLTKLHSSTHQLNSLVDDLYDLALTDAGALNYRKQDVDLADVFRVTIESAEQSLIEAGLSLKVQLSDELEIFADPKRLRQVVDNLVKNSRRYTNRNGTIMLAAWKEGSEIYFTVEDSAPGVEPETIPRLFDRFYREESSRNRATGGAGLGLAICRNIVEAHQGSIEAEASELGGLKVTVVLPVEG